MAFARIEAEYPRRIDGDGLQRAVLERLLMVGMIGGYSARLSSTLGEIEMETVRGLADLVRTHNKPIIAQSVYAPAPIAALRSDGIPIFTFAETAVQGARALVDYAAARRRPAASETVAIPPAPSDAAAIIERARADNRQALYDHEARALMRAHGVNVPPACGSKLLKMSRFAPCRYVMVCLTNGLLEETNSQARFQRLSDVAMAEFYR